MRVAFPLSVPNVVKTFEIQTFDEVTFFSIKLLSDNRLPKIAYDVRFGASLVPTCKMTLSGAF